MFRCGVLVVSGALKDLRSRLPFLLKASSKHVRDVLYVDLLAASEVEKNFQHRRNLYDLLRETYSCTLKGYNNLDVRVILPRSKPVETCGVLLSRDPEVAILDRPGTVADQERWLCSRFRNTPVKQIRYIEDTRSGTEENSTPSHEHDGIISDDLMAYPCTVLGGTFDKIHNGHRLLLSVACLMCESKITVGLSDGKLLENKTLAELIEPFEVRKQQVADFISDIKPELIQEIVPIEDPMGPTATDPLLDCLVVSQETIRGGDMINEVRKGKGLKNLDVHAIDLIFNDDNDEEDNIPSKGKDNSKLSSTTERHFQLGTLLKPPLTQVKEAGEPYVIGLTGGIASGKSSICERLRKLGAQIVDCDKLGHVAYQQGSAAYEEVVRTFGQDVVAADGNIDRKKLGEIVFTSKEQLDILCSIVWPEIARLAKGQIQSYSQEGCPVVVLDAAVLLEAEWDKFVDEVWVMVLPVSEALTRIMERNNLTEEQARKRIDSQMTNSDRFEKANVVLSTQWEPEYSQKQVEKAWKELQARISSPGSNL